MHLLLTTCTLEKESWQVGRLMSLETGSSRAGHLLAKGERLNNGVVRTGNWDGGGCHLSECRSVHAVDLN